MNLRSIYNKKRLCDFSNGDTEVTLPSHISDSANIEINIEKSIENLKNFKNKYENVVKTPLASFISDIRGALSLPKEGGISKYGYFAVNGETISIRLSNHNVNANNYIRNNSNYSQNVSIVIKRKDNKNTFKPNDNVILEEFVYLDNRLSKIENPFIGIIDSIIDFLKTGKFDDKTGVALHNVSPVSQNIQSDVEKDSIADYKNCKDMKKIKDSISDSALEQLSELSSNELMNIMCEFFNNDVFMDFAIEMQDTDEFKQWALTHIKDEIRESELVESGWIY